MTNDINIDVVDVTRRYYEKADVEGFVEVNVSGSSLTIRKSGTRQVLKVDCAIQVPTSDDVSLVDDNIEVELASDLLEKMSAALRALTNR